MWTDTASRTSYWIREANGCYIMYQKTDGLERIPTINLWWCGSYQDFKSSRRYDFEDTDDDL